MVFLKSARRNSKAQASITKNSSIFLISGAVLCRDLRSFHRGAKPLLRFGQLESARFSDAKDDARIQKRRS